MKRFEPNVAPSASLPLGLICVATLLAGCARQPERPNVLLVTIDTLRADRISAAGYERETTPVLDALAAEGLLFTHCQTPRAKTTPAVASLLTGLYPHEHGVRDLASPLDKRPKLLPDAFRSAGYNTFGLIGNWVLKDENSGLKRGFATWVEKLPDRVGVPPHDAPQRTAGSLTDAAIDTIGLEARSTAPSAAENTRKPWFAWVHYMDPHGLYSPPEAHRVFESEDEFLPDFRDLPPHPIHRPRLANYNIPPETRRGDELVSVSHIRNLYDGEVHYVDTEIGRLLAALEASGQKDNTLVVITADHGESLGEHRDWFEHGFYTYENTCRVPLIMRLHKAHPQASKRGLRHGDISLVDLAPTILDLVRLDPLPRPPGRPASIPAGVSRAHLVAKDSAAGHPVFSEKIERLDNEGTVQHKSVRMGDWKLIQRFARPRLGAATELVVLTEELYGLAQDPGETNNVIDAPPFGAPLEILRRELERFTAAEENFGELAHLLQRQREELERGDPESLRALDALGY